MEWVIVITRYTLGALLVAGLTHYALWTWFKRSFPSFARRHRRWLLALLVVLAASALARLGMRSFAWSGWAFVGAVAMVWQMVVATVVIPLTILRAGHALAAFVRKKRTGETTTPAAASAEDVAQPSPEGLDRRAALERFAGLGLLGVSSAVYGEGCLFGRFDIAVETVPLRIAKLPRALDGFTIVQLSDLHVGAFNSGAALARTIDLAQSLSPDLFVITGDLVDIQEAYIPEAAGALARLRARHGVFAILGNHDYYVGGDLVREGMRAAGVPLLMNECIEIAKGDGGGFVLAGLDDVAGRWGRGSAGGPDIDRALGGVAPDRAIVLLAHQPHLFERAAGRIDVQLSGHTHGGQVRAGFTPTRLLYPYVAGRYELRGSTMWVNRGLGVVGPPVRIGARPELTRVILIAG